MDKNLPATKYASLIDRLEDLTQQELLEAINVGIGLQRYEEAYILSCKGLIKFASPIFFNKINYVEKCLIPSKINDRFATYQNLALKFKVDLNFESPTTFYEDLLSKIGEFDEAN